MPLARLAHSGNSSILCDQVGTPLEMVDARGQATWRAELSSYGRLRHVQGARGACPFRYQGQYEDVETGLYYNRFRYFDPTTGGYLSQDPIGLAGGLAAYAYVPDPNCWVDIFGLSGVCKLRDSKGQFRKPLTAQEELQQGTLSGRRARDIEARLQRRGYNQVPAHSGGKVWTKAMPDGNTAAVRVDPAIVRQNPMGFADEVPHAHKEILPSANVTNGNYGPPHISQSTALDDAGSIIASPTSNAGRRAAHIPIR